MSYKRTIKFCYYKVCLFTKIDDHVKSENFDLVDWLATVADNDLLQKNIELSDTKVNFEIMYHYEKDDIYVFRVYKLRDRNIPSKIKEGTSAEPIHLEDDEYIGEDMTILYDWKNSICMIQQNRMSVGVSRLAEWINKDLNYDDSTKVKFVPISDKFTTGKLKNKYVRTIEFSFANMEAPSNDGPLYSIINSIGRYNGVNAKIAISVGHAKDAQLNPDAAYDLICDIQCNPGIIGSAKAKLKSYTDDDKARVEVVDIFETSSHDYIEFEIESKKPLEFDQARIKMYNTYLQRKGNILKLCQK